MNKIICNCRLVKHVCVIKAEQRESESVFNPEAEENNELYLGFSVRIKKLFPLFLLPNFDFDQRRTDVTWKTKMKMRLKSAERVLIVLDYY